MTVAVFRCLNSLFGQQPCFGEIFDSLATARIPQSDSQTPHRERIIELMNEYHRPEWLCRYQDFKSLCSDVCGEFIRFYLTTGCDQISYTHSQNTDGLPNYSCRLTAADGAVLLLAIDDWRDRMEEVPGLVRTWLGEHSALKGFKPSKSHYQGDRYWLEQWQLANPW